MADVIGNLIDWRSVLLDSVLDPGDIQHDGLCQMKIVIPDCIGLMTGQNTGSGAGGEVVEGSLRCLKLYLATAGSDSAVVVDAGSLKGANCGPKIVVFYGFRLQSQPYNSSQTVRITQT